MWCKIKITSLHPLFQTKVTACVGGPLCLPFSTIATRSHVAQTMLGLFTEIHCKGFGKLSPNKQLQKIKFWDNYIKRSKFQSKLIISCWYHRIHEYFAENLNHHYYWSLIPSIWTSFVSSISHISLIRAIHSATPVQKMCYRARTYKFKELEDWEY